eukprot:SAG22_NODE_18373_length_288_cov_1.084656_1_plen_39_part_01
MWYFADLPAAVHFYTEVLGLAVVSNAQSHVEVQLAGSSM